jgi:hypothetical protein
MANRNATRIRSNPAWQAAQAAYLAEHDTPEATFGARIIAASRMHRLARTEAGKSIDGLTSLKDIEAEVLRILTVDDGEAAFLPLLGLAGHLKAEVVDLKAREDRTAGDSS